MSVTIPPAGWAAPWPQCLELAQALDSSKWTLIGGLMVQLHAVVANLPMIRPTTDVDVVLHVETGSVSGPEVTRTLNQLGYTLQTPLSTASPAHRFIRQREGMKESIDVMVADHGVSKPPLTLGGREPFLVPAGTQALKRTLNCRVMDVAGELVTTLSIPSVLAAVVLKAAAYREDSRDRERHLEDAALLSTMLGDPLALVPQLQGSDRSRIISMHHQLSDPHHPAWARFDEEHRHKGQYALEILASNPQDFELDNDLGPAF
ncbi:hypothetical protein OK351_12475 [Glutamicibacter sp. MNS18]|uniref:hypothetical protein n=1 Tax=Glutamicibacter sp. MNS18 TaxID=2989817 RepID=UPI0022366C98|nr:hypothetical protein [Glutamicibacter sp. MNS18]MCW4466313.1 hypothetical protein [Glutamicibacter sp. MNS18]